MIIKSVMESEEARDVIKDYTAFQGQLSRLRARQQIEAWGAEMEKSSQAKLPGPLLRSEVDPSSHKNCSMRILILCSTRVSRRSEVLPALIKDYTAFQGQLSDFEREHGQFETFRWREIVFKRSVDGVGRRMMYNSGCEVRDARTTAQGSEVLMLIKTPTAAPGDLWARGIFRRHMVSTPSSGQRLRFVVARGGCGVSLYSCP